MGNEAITWEAIGVLIVVGGVLFGGIWKFMAQRKSDLDALYTRMEAIEEGIKAEMKTDKKEIHKRIEDHKDATATKFEDYSGKVGDLGGQLKIVVNNK